MKTIGLIGGTTWVSTLEYYRIINEEINARLGKQNTGKILLYSVNFQEVLDLQKNKDLPGLLSMILNAADDIINARAECVLLCANTMHRFAPEVIDHIPVPLIHIAKETGRKINDAGLRKIGLLGTKITMEEDFYKSILGGMGIETIVPEADDRDFINKIIFAELARDIFKDTTRDRLIKIIAHLHKQGAEGIILGCTELPLIIKPGNTNIQLFDTLKIHATAAVDFALK